VIEFYSQAVMRITEGALAPPPPLRPLEPARARHIERLGGHATLVAAACKAGGACAGAPPEQIEALGRFGAELGLAMLLADELDAFAAAPPPSLRAGAVSLPVVFAAHHGNGERVAAALGGGDEAELGWVVHEVARYGAAPTRAEVVQLASRAADALAALPPSAGRDGLAQAAAVLARRSGAGGEPFPPRVG
jgi:geranylgeranyl pyrophosphate synthase